MHMIWKYIFRPFLFLFDPETAHHITLDGLKMICKIPGVKSIIKLFYSFQNKIGIIELFGLKFKNPVGLAAGLDKDGKYIEELALFGFSHIEIGTVTPKPQGGNPKPRLFRLLNDQALINRMGFNNEGVVAMVECLKKLNKPADLILGINIGKNKDTPLENAADDYLKCFEALHLYADYFTINISSPNTPGLRGLQEREPLINLLSQMGTANKLINKPILVKIAPDLDDDQLLEIKEIILAQGMNGIIMGNTTLDRSTLKTGDAILNTIGAGGLSGVPLQHKSNDRLVALTQMPGRIPLIGVGGIMCEESAKDKLTQGAGLIQVYTGFIYNGPGLIKRICKSLQ